jgi:hypothetical protein
LNGFFSELLFMQELTLAELNEVSGADMATAVSYGTGLAASVLCGAALGPAGMAVAAAVYTASYGITTYLNRPPQPRSQDNVGN